MIVMPAVILGGLVVAGIIFFLGFLLTNTILSKIAKRRRGFSTLYQNNLNEKQQLDDSTEKYIEVISVIGGTVAIGLAVILLFSMRNDQTIVIWILLTGLGVLFGFLSPVIFSSNRNPVAKTGAPPHPPDQRSETTNTYQGSTSKIRQENKIIIVCENCSQKIRIPKRNDKLIVTCPICRREFKYQYYGLGVSSNSIKIFYRRIGRWVSRFFVSRNH